MRKLTMARLLAWKTAGNVVMLCTFPFYLVDKAFDVLSKGVTRVCMWAVVPSILIYDWCVKRHNALRARASEPPHEAP